MANNKIELEGLAPVNGGLSQAILTSKSPVFEYKDNQRVGELPIAWRFGVVLPGGRFSGLTVKIDGATDPLPELTDESIGEACRAKAILVTFTDLKVTLYTIKGELVKSGMATGISVVGK